MGILGTLFGAVLQCFMGFSWRAGPPRGSWRVSGSPPKGSWRVRGFPGAPGEFWGPPRSFWRVQGPPRRFLEGSRARLEGLRAFRGPLEGSRSVERSWRVPGGPWSVPGEFQGLRGASGGFERPPRSSWRVSGPPPGSSWRVRGSPQGFLESFRVPLGGAWGALGLVEA